MIPQLIIKLFRHPAYSISIVLSITVVITAAVILKISANSGEILFMAKVMGPVTNIYSADRSGNIRKITDNQLWRDITPDVSIHGEIAFASNRHDNPPVDLYQHSEDFNIFIADKNGQNIKQITSSPNLELKPIFSPNGKYLAYLVNENKLHKLAVFLPDSSETRVLAIADDIFDFSWSPDSRSIGFVDVSNQTSSLKTVDIGNEQSQTLASVAINSAAETAGQDDSHPMQIVSVQWSPDGKKLAYIRHPLAQMPRELYVFNLDTSKAIKVSNGSCEVQAPVYWSKNSNELLYSALVDYQYYYDETVYKKVYKGGMHIFISDLNGNSRQLTHGDHLFKNPVFSADGKQIAFLYADTLGARTLSLRIMDTEGIFIKQLYDSVTQLSALIWTEAL